MTCHLSLIVAIFIKNEQKKNPFRFRLHNQLKDEECEGIKNSILSSTSWRKMAKLVRGVYSESTGMNFGFEW